MSLSSSWLTDRLTDRFSLWSPSIRSNSPGRWRCRWGSCSWGCRSRPGSTASSSWRRRRWGSGTPPPPSWTCRGCSSARPCTRHSTWAGRPWCWCSLRWWSWRRAPLGRRSGTSSLAGERGRGGGGGVRGQVSEKLNGKKPKYKHCGLAGWITGGRNKLVGRHSLLLPVQPLEVTVVFINSLLFRSQPLGHSHVPVYVQNLSGVREFQRFQWRGKLSLAELCL